MGKIKPQFFVSFIGDQVIWLYTHTKKFVSSNLKFVFFSFFAMLSGLTFCYLLY